MPTPLATAIVRTAGMSAAPRAGGPGRRQRREKHGGHTAGRESHRGGSAVVIPVTAKAPRAGAVARNPAERAARLFNRELSWLDFDQRVLEVAADNECAAARAREALRDRRLEPRRVLRGTCRRPVGTDRVCSQTAVSRRTDARSDTDGCARAGARPAGGAGSALVRRAASRSRRGRHPHRLGGRVHGPRAAIADEALPARDRAAPDPDRGRRGRPFPASAVAGPEHRRHRDRRRQGRTALHPRQRARRPAAVHRGRQQRRPRRDRGRDPAFLADGRRGRRDRPHRFPHHARCRFLRLRRRRRSARGRRDTAAAPALRRRRAARGRRRCADAARRPAPCTSFTSTPHRSIRSARRSACARWANCSRSIGPI